jgi:hypothetical protein
LIVIFDIMLALRERSAILLCTLNKQGFFAFFVHPIFFFFFMLFYFLEKIVSGFSSGPRLRVTQRNYGYAAAAQARRHRFIVFFAKPTKQESQQPRRQKLQSDPVSEAREP